MPWYPIHKIIDGKKKCAKCGREILIHLFPRQNKNKDGLRPECKECNNKKNKLYYENNRVKILEKTRQYGKTDHRKKYAREYAKIKLKAKREKQANRPRPTVCECCNSISDKKGIVWDHNHKNGKFRGWLCNRCNRVLGMCVDSVEVFKNLIRYLEIYG